MIKNVSSSFIEFFWLQVNFAFAFTYIATHYAQVHTEIISHLIGQLSPSFNKITHYFKNCRLFWVTCIICAGIAVLEGPMYAVGGHDGWSYLNTVERWDPQARQWNYVASMSTPRSTMGVTALNGKWVGLSFMNLQNIYSTSSRDRQSIHDSDS